MAKGDRSLDVQGREVREMRNAETVLGIIQSAVGDDCRWEMSIDSCSTRNCSFTPMAGSIETTGP